MNNSKEESQREPTAQEELDEDEINLIDYFRVVFKYRRTILLICGVAVVATGIVSLLSPKTYSATVSIVPPIEIMQQESELTRRKGLGAAESSLLRKAIGTMSIADLYIGFLRSRVVEDAIIDRFDLLKVYEVEKRFLAREILRNSTIIKTSEETGGNIIHITVMDRDPNRAAAMANAYVEELDQQNKRLSTGEATNKRIFLENRLKEIEEKLSKIDNILSREAKIQEMLFELLSQEYEIAKIEEAKSMPTIQVLDRAVVPEQRMPRGTKKKVLLAGVASLTFTVILAFFLEYLHKSDVTARLTKRTKKPSQDGQPPETALQE